MKNKGFTLIELLAVIVILAIIALIATPIILNIISNTREATNKRSVELYASAVENAVANYLLFNPYTKVKGNFTSSEDGKTLIQNDIELKVDYSGNRVKCEIVNVTETGKLELSGCIVSNGDNEYTYEEGSGVTPNPTPDDSQTTEILCRKAADSTTHTTPIVEGGNYKYGDKYVCDLGTEASTKGLVFYVLQDGDKSGLTKYIGTPVKITENDAYGTAGAGEVALIMERNIDERTISWSTGSDNSTGPDKAKTKLPTSATWTKLEDTQISLPTYHQIYQVNNRRSGISSWLYGYLNNYPRNPHGYWLASAISNDSSNVWFVSSLGRVDNSHVSVDNVGGSGIRPVITLAKSSLSS